jgi:hypothetical protein
MTDRLPDLQVLVGLRPRISVASSTKAPDNAICVKISPTPPPSSSSMSLIRLYSIQESINSVRVSLLSIVRSTVSKSSSSSTSVARSSAPSILGEEEGSKGGGGMEKA